MKHLIAKAAVYLCYDHLQSDVSQMATAFCDLHVSIVTPWRRGSLRTKLLEQHHDLEQVRATPGTDTVTRSSPAHLTQAVHLYEEKAARLLDMVARSVRN